MIIKKLLKKMYFLINEKKYAGRLKYLLKKKQSDTLIISFSGFSSTPVYNYIRTLKKINADQLYILDDFGLRGSYYWFESGYDNPNKLVQGLINNVILKGNYKRIITLGTSKGGTCAIYFGLMFGATDIYAGACQYLVGKYLNTEEHLPILKSMMGDINLEAAVNILDRMLLDMFKLCYGSKSKVHLLYSKLEHTYDDHIKFLVEDLRKYKILYDERIETFENHNDVGKYFSPWIIEKLNNNQYEQ